MNRKIIAIALAAMSLAACAETAPEDFERKLSLNWSLAPDNAAVTRRTVEAGDVILSWTAKAKATHVMVSSTGTVNLVMAPTTYGRLYCSQQSCYEDRDGDGAFEYVWEIYRNGSPPNEPRVARNPKAIKVPVGFRAIETTGVAVFEQLLALIYTGPVEGVPKEDQTLMPMLGELSVGWFGGINAPRTPDGAGWVPEQNIPMILVDGGMPKTTVNPIGLTYQPFRATIDGMLDLEFQARAVDDVNLDAKLKFDVEGEKDKPPADKTLVPPPQT